MIIFLLFQMSIFVKLRNILIIIKVFYWLAFKATVRAIFMKNVSLAHQYWAEYASQYFKIKILKSKNSLPMQEGRKTLILTNHRSQADFFVHNIITNCQCNFLSRMAVGVVFFVFGLSSSDSVWFFNRSGNIDPQKFNRWMDTKYQKSQRPMLLVYPQGHRMGATTSVSKEHLKTGMMRYGYRRGLPCQFLMAFGNQKVFNEKKLHMSWGESIFYSFSKVYNPQDYQNETEFVNTIKDEFTKYFEQVYNLYSNNGETDMIIDYNSS